MRTLSLCLGALLLAGFVFLPTGHAQPKKPKEDLAVKVEQTIKKGMEFLKRDSGGHGVVGAFRDHKRFVTLWFPALMAKARVGRQLRPAATELRHSVKTT